jgi:hypothetical protein
MDEERLHPYSSQIETPHAVTKRISTSALSANALIDNGIACYMAGKYDEQVFRKGETVSHEDDDASPYRGSFRRAVQG